MQKLILAAGVCLLSCLSLRQTVHAQNQPVDLTGKWQIHFNDDNGVSKSAPKLVLTQSRDKITGTFGEYDWPVIGVVDGNTVVFTFVAFGQENSGREISDTVFYWGTIAAGEMRGRMKNPKEAGTWVAQRQ